MILRLFFFLSVLAFLPFSYKTATAGFRLGKLLPASYPHAPQFDPAYRKALEQPYTYLARGCQAYVFLSEDKKHVLKLFRRRKSVEKEHLFCKAATLAYTKAKHETALEAIHLSPGENLPTVVLRGRLGRSFSLPLDAVAFALQKKVEPLKNGEDLRGFLKKRLEKGILNLDRNPDRNWGILDGEIIEIDFGSYIEEPGMTEAKVEEELARWSPDFSSS